MTQETATQSLSTVTFSVEGMTCGNCVRHVNEALQENLTLVDHQVDLAGAKLTATFDPAVTTIEAIAETMNEAGYPVTQQ
ncbi:copper exporting ATPase [compost metagenome]